MNLSSLNLNSFLKLGYFLDYRNDKYVIDFSQIDNKKYDSCSEDELIRIGAKIFHKSIRENFQENEKHLVPISGGLDSRAILAGLLELTEASNIHTYTFGTPGTLDYEIGNQVAAKTGTRHVRYPLTNYQYTLDELFDIAKRFDYQTILFHHPPVKEIDYLFKDYFIWIGFLGETLTGSHLPSSPADTLTEAKENFIRKNSYTKSINLINCKNEELYQLIECDLIDKERLSIEEQMDFQNRQPKYIAPHVLLEGFRWRTPFLYADWIEFSLSVGKKYRFNQYLYKKILLKMYPKIFSIPTKSCYGLPLEAGRSSVNLRRLKNKVRRIINNKLPLFPDPNINYLDFNEAIRNRKDIREIVLENMLDLKSRKIVDWIDIEQIYRRHINKQSNHADALIVLTSLEIFLKANSDSLQ